MRFNPFGRDWSYANDLADFKIPYQLVSRTDYELMKRRYQGLHNNSYGHVVRLFNYQLK